MDYTKNESEMDIRMKVKVTEKLKQNISHGWYCRLTSQILFFHKETAASLSEVDHDKTQPNHLMKASLIQNAVSVSYDNIFGILKSSQQIWVKSNAKDVNRSDSIQAKSFGGMQKL